MVAIVWQQGLTASAGDYWQVTGSGTHNVDGNTSWNLNDFCIYSGSAGGTGDWIKLAFEDTIASIVLGDLSSSSFHLGADNDKHIIFASGSVHSGSNNFTFDYNNNNLLLSGNLHIADDKKLSFGATDDAHIEFNEDLDNFLVISGSSAGVVLSGSNVIADGNVGIGTASPTVALEIDGDIKLSPTAITTTHITTAGGMRIRANDSISIGDLDADSVRIGRTNSALAKIHIRSGADTDLVVFGNKVGIGTETPDRALAVTGTLGVSDHATISGNIYMADDKKIIFGADNDSHIEYDEDGANHLIISGSSAGVVLSGSNVIAEGKVGIGTSSPTVALEIDGDIKLSPTAITTTHITTDGSMRIRANNSINIGDDDTDSVRIGRTNTTLAKIHIRSGADTDLVVSDSKVGIGTDSPTFKLDVNGATRHSDDVTVVDDKKVIFGTDNDAHIEYNEDEDDHLVISGSSSGMVLSGTMVQVSGNMVVKFPNYFAVTSNPSQNASSFYVQTGQGVQFHNGADNGGVTIRDAGDVHISDDKKIIFGINEDSHIEYNENGDDFLVISGSAKGIALSGTNVAIDGRLIGAGDEDTYIDLSLTANDQINLVAGGNYYATFLNGTPKIINFNALQEDIDFKINQDAGLALHMSGSDGILHSHYGIVVHDDKKVIFGGNSDGHIEYNENGDDFLIVSGSSNGVAISGSVVALDGTTNVAGTFIADAGISWNTSANRLQFTVNWLRWR